MDTSSWCTALTIQQTIRNKHLLTVLQALASYSLLVARVRRLFITGLTTIVGATAKRHRKNDGLPAGCDTEPAARANLVACN